MANRSYLYNIDFNRLERAKTKEDRVIGVCEYAYDIPLAFKILLSDNPINTYSMIWEYEHPIAIAGNADGGKQKLFDFLEQLKKKKLFDPKKLDEQVSKTKDYFDKHIFSQQYFFMESGEIYEMGDKPLEEQNLELYHEIQYIDKTIESFYAQVIAIDDEIEKLERSRNEMTPKKWFRKPKFVLDDSQRSKIKRQIDQKTINKLKLLGIDNWSTVLYFHFGG